MALRSRFGSRITVPSISTRKEQTKQLSYTGGVDTYTDNDDVGADKLVYATDTRMVKKGRYKTRKGANRYSVPVGEAVSASQTSTTGASVQVVNGERALAEKFTASSTGVITKAEINIRTTTSSSGTLLVEFYTSVAGLPGVLLGTSSLAPAAITSSLAYVSCFFMEAPSVSNGQDLWLVVRGQDLDVGTYEVSTTTSSTNAATMAGATTWTAAAYSLNAKMYVSDANPVKGVYRGYRSNGLKVTLFAAGTTMYTVDDVTGATTAIQTGLNAAATRYRFEMAQDAIYWVNGLEKPYKYDLVSGTVTQLTAAPEVPHTIIEHKGLVFYGNTVDRSQQFYTNFGVYDTFTSTDFLTIMAPKSPNIHTAVAKLNGILYVFANKNKYAIMGDSNATWSLDEASDQRGTFSQESLVYNENYIFHADEDGVHQFNGSESANLAEPFLEDYKAIPDKSTITLELFNNRLYIFYRPASQAVNTECFVINTLLNIYEGKDLKTYIGRTFARFTQDDIYIQASNRAAALYYGEAPGNDYDNLGTPLTWELRTSYGHFDAPAQRKRVPIWRPVFNAATSNYSVEVGYAFDGQLDATYQSISLSGNNPKFDTGLKYDTGVKFASLGGSVEPSNLSIPGEFKRLQRRYRHVGAHEPVEFDSEVLTLQTQRMR